MRAERPKIWREVLVKLAKKNPPTFSAADLAKDRGVTYANAAQLLKRLQTWGHLRLVGFDDPAGGGVGRRRKVYEVTDHGRRAAAWKGKKE